MIVIDTHILLWFLLDDARLNPIVKGEMSEKPDSVIVPSMVVWESLVLAQNGHIVLNVTEPAAAIRKWIRDSGFLDAPLTADIVILSRTLDFVHDDPADRFIAATARALNARLATDDRRLRALPWVELAY